MQTACNSLTNQKYYGLLNQQFETFEEHPILLKYKEGDNFNHRNTLKYFED